MKTGLRVLIVDDEKMIREAVIAYLNKMGCETYEADNGKDALLIFKNENIDFIILDLMLPGMSGEEICQSIRAVSRVPIIMLTAKTTEESILNGLQIGADDYVTKPFSVKELYARMEAVMRRMPKEQKSIYAIETFEGGLWMDFQQCEVKKNDSLINLTKSEWRILSAMVRYPGKVFSREELMDAVFGDDSDSFDRVIDSHIKNLRKKIESDPKTPVYIKTVHGLGYKFGGEKCP